MHVAVEKERRRESGLPAASGTDADERDLMLLPLLLGDGESDEREDATDRGDNEASADTSDDVDDEAKDEMAFAGAISTDVDRVASMDGDRRPWLATVCPLALFRTDIAKDERFCESLESRRINPGFLVLLGVVAVVDGGEADSDSGIAESGGVLDLGDWTVVALGGLDWPGPEGPRGVFLTMNDRLRNDASLGLEVVEVVEVDTETGSESTPVVGIESLGMAVGAPITTGRLTGEQPGGGGEGAGTGLECRGEIAS